MSIGDPGLGICGAPVTNGDGGTMFADNLAIVGDVSTEFLGGGEGAAGRGGDITDDVGTGLAGWVWREVPPSELCGHVAWRTAKTCGLMFECEVREQ